MIRVPACARVSRVSRVCPGSPRCLFTGILYHYTRYRRRRERQVRESADSRAADNITAIHADYCVPRFSWRELLDHWNSICLLIDASF